MTDEIKKEEELVEFKASGEDSSVAEPVATNVKKRIADKEGTKDAPAKVEDPINKEGGDMITSKGKKAPTRSADKAAGMKEAVDEIFGEEDLSEEFKEKAATIFEAAVLDRVNQITTSLEEEYAERFETEIAAAKSELEENVDTYLNYVVEQWMENNQLAIETGIKSEIAEGFLNGLKDLFEEHYVDLPEEKVDVAEELVSRVAELEEQLGEAVKKNAELSETIDNFEIANILDEVVADLSMTQKEKLLGLAEGISFSSIDEYRSKLETIKESYVSTKKAAVEAEEQLNEEYEGEDESSEVVVDDQMRAYIDAVSRSIKK